MGYKSNNLFSFENTIASEIFGQCEDPWEVLPKISEFVIKLGKTLDKQKFDEIKENVWVAKTAQIAETAVLTAPLIIDEYAQVRHCAFIRGSAIIGKNAVVGNSTEIKNAILFDNAQAPHYNYIGDSVLGYKAHFGAGAITSNLKADKSLVTISYYNKVVKTGLKKFGAIVGDCSEIGCNAVLNPGTIVGKNTNIYPLSMVRGYVDENSIYKNSGNIIRKD